MAYANLFWNASCVTLALFIISSSVTANPAAINIDKTEVSSSSVLSEENKDRLTCQYSKRPWSECDYRSHTKTRTLTLKKGQDRSKCEKTKTIHKKCKRTKTCRYEKGTWSKCNSENQMIRTDILKKSDPSCQKTKDLFKPCKNESETKGQQKKHTKKEKLSKHHHQEHNNGRSKNKNKDRT